MTLFKKAAFALIVGLALSCSVVNNSKKNLAQSNSASPKLQRIGSSPAGKPPVHLFCLETQQCWIWDARSLWRSSDGGKSWDQINSTEQEDSQREFSFSSEQDGWGIFQSALFNTTDGGSTWRQQTTPFDGHGEIRKLVSLTAPGVVWLAGAIQRPQTKEEQISGVPNNARVGESVLQEAIFRTDDRGKHWKRASLTRLLIGRILDLRFSDAMRGIAIGERTIYYTTDGGNIWKLADFNKKCVAREFLTETYEGQPTSVAMLDSGLAWASYDDGRIIKSQDAGHSWCDLVRPVEIPFEATGPRYFTTIEFADSQRGWALGWDKYLYETMNGGANWSRLNPNSRYESLFLLGHGYVLLLSREDTDEKAWLGKL